MQDDHGNEVTVREYVEAILRERDRQYDLRYRAQQEALITAREEMTRRLEGLNELRREVTDDRGRFLSVERYEPEHRAQQEALDQLENFQSRMLGLIAGTAIVSAILGAAVAAIVAHFIG